VRPNGLRKVWEQGGTALNAWLALGSSYAAEIIAHLPYDSVTVDLQHGMQDFETALTMFQALSTSDSVPLARIPANQSWMVQRVLDAGAYGVICPMISSAAECRHFVAACKYPPTGERSYGPARGLLYGGRDYALHANDCILTLAMIETPQGLSNAAEILAVPGLDGIYIGPSDLALSLGRPVIPQVHQEVRDAATHLLRLSKAAGKRAGIFCPTKEFGAEMVELGFDLVTVSTDAEILRTAAMTVLDTVRRAPLAVHAGNS
jgi:4-hydroxy-2-oxoheptanedioate aldolase